MFLLGIKASDVYCLIVGIYGHFGEDNMNDALSFCDNKNIWMVVKMCKYAHYLSLLPLLQDILDTNSNL